MKTLSRHVVFCMTMVFLCGAQPKWVKKVLQDAQAYTASKGAEALILHNTKQVIISSDGRAKATIQYAVKILNPEGKVFGAISEWTAPFRKMKKFKGWTVARHGKIHKYSDKDLTEVSTSEASGYYDDSHLVRLNMSNGDPGSIVAFEYEIEEKDWSNLRQSFQFQRQQPVKFAQFTVQLPEGWQIQTAEWHCDEHIAYARHGQQHTWTARNLDYRPWEPLMPPWNYLVRRVQVACYNPQGAGVLQFQDWGAAARWCAQLFSQPASVDTSIQKMAQHLTDGLPTSAEKVSAIAEFVRDDIRYVAVEIGKGRWYPRSASTTLYNRYGDCKDKTTLMRALLKAIGIDSAPVFANTSRAVQPDLATPFQFNHCIIAIPMVAVTDDTSKFKAAGNGWLFFDPTDESTRLGDLPYRLKGGRVLIGTPEDSTLIRLPRLTPESYLRRYLVDAYLAENGSLSASVVIRDYGNLAHESDYNRRKTAPEKQIEEWISTLSENIPAVELSGYQISPQDDSVSVSFRLGADSYGQRIGNLLVFKPDFFIRSQPQLLTDTTRYHPIWFGAPKQIERTIVWHLPEGWYADSPDIPNESSSGTATYSYETAIDQGDLHYDSFYQQTGYLLSAEAYAAAQEFSQHLSEFSQLLITLEKTDMGEK